MLQRIASALLVVAVALVGTGSCPRLVGAACNRPTMGAEHRCCSHASLGSRERCCRDGEAPVTAVHAPSGERQVDMTAAAVAALNHTPLHDGGIDRVVRRALWRNTGLAPPFSLVIQHTLLLV